MSLLFYAFLCLYSCPFRNLSIRYDRYGREDYVINCLAGGEHGLCITFINGISLSRLVPCVYIVGIDNNICPFQHSKGIQKSFLDTDDFWLPRCWNCFVSIYHWCEPTYR